MKQEKAAPEATARTILSAAIGVFMTYGYRKTSLADVAEAAGLSRQTLYMQFKNKLQLFREAVAYDLRKNLTDATASIANTNEPRDALLGAFHFWHGQFVEQKIHVETDFLSSAVEHAGDIMMHHESEFLKLIADHLDASGLVQMRSQKLSAVDLADLLNTQSKGLKMSIKSTAAYHEKMRSALTALFG